MTVDLSAPRAVVDLARRLEDAGFETWAVGGAVRDALRGLATQDWDLATRARPDEVRRLFRRTVPIGLDHGTVGVFGVDGVLYEVTTFRLDVIPLGRKAVVSYADTLEEDLARRDFTINALAWHPIRHELRDPFDGQADLSAGVLRAVGEAGDRFREDYLRILRGLRFAGNLELTIDPGTWTGLVEATDGLALLSAERIREELLKLMEGDTPSRALDLYRRAGVLEHMDVALETPDGPDPFSLVDAVPSHRRVLRLAAFFLRVLPDSGPDEVAAALTRLRFSNAEVRRIGAVLAAGLPPDSWPDALARRRWMAGVGRPELRDVLRLWIAGLRSGVWEGPESDTVLRQVRGVRGDLASGLPLVPAELPVSGSDLMESGWRPGPALGRALHALLEGVWADPGAATRDALLEAARSLPRE